MPDRSKASKEYADWLDGIGLSAPVGSDHLFDEIPGFVNSSALGKFSLDDLDFGEDLTRGRIDFDDEYLLKSPGILTGGESASVMPVPDERSHGVSHTEGHTYKHTSQTAVPRSVQQAGSYSSVSSSAAGENVKTQRRQMPTSGLSMQESIFEGFEDAARTFGVEPKFMEGVKNYIDKAPTQWMLRREQRQSARRDPTHREERKAQAVPAVSPAGSIAPPKARPTRARRERRQKKVSPLVFIVVFMCIIRFSTYVFQAVRDHTGQIPTGGGTTIVTPGGGTATVTPGGGGMMPTEMIDKWEDVYASLSAVRESNTRVPFSELNVDDTADYLTENGWDLVTVNKDGEESYVEAELVQKNSVSSIYIDNTTVRLGFRWTDAKWSASEVEHAWEAILPNDQSMYPGKSEMQLIVSPEMTQIVRIIGKEANYGRMTEHYTSAGRLFIAIYDNEESGWDLQVLGDNDSMISLSTDNPEHYLERLEITGPENENFR